MILPIEFTDTEIRQYLKDLGYEIKKTSYTETLSETDESYGGTYKREVEVALKPAEKIKKEMLKIALCGNGTPFYCQEYTKVFKELMTNKFKKVFLEVEKPYL
jgi:hypothetical protein